MISARNAAESGPVTVPVPLSFLDALSALDALSVLVRRPVRVIAVAGLIIAGPIVLARGGQTLLGVGLLLAGMVWGLIEAWFFYVHST